MNEGMKEKLLEELLEMFQNMPAKDSAEEKPEMGDDKKGASIEMVKVGGHSLNDDEGAELKDKLKGMC